MQENGVCMFLVVDGGGDIECLEVELCFHGCVRLDAWVCEVRRGSLYRGGGLGWRIMDGCFE